MRQSLLPLMVLTLAACGGDGGNGGGAAGGGGGGSSEDIQPVTITLEEMNNSGKSGTAELQSGAASTEIAIALEPPEGDNEPIHIHRGTCDSPGERSSTTSGSRRRGSARARPSRCSPS